ncbi:MAG: YHS domain-containing (seleno)protein, partial [Candidatus Sumerlaeota bacterium]
HFLLKTECPFCIKHTRSYLENADKVADVEQVFIKPDADEEITKWAGKIDPKTLPTIYRDADAKLADQFGIPGGYSFHNETVHYPALVILDPAGKEVFRYIGKANTDRYTFDKFEAKMAELTRTKAIDQYNLKSGEAAIEGFDPVSYLKDGAATKGNEQIVSNYRGVMYQFASAENRALFAQDPEKYVPAYGGWCATAMANGDKVKIQPDNFKVTNGRTFLFYKGLLGDAKKDWVKDEPTETKKADGEWTKLLAK